MLVSIEGGEGVTVVHEVSVMVDESFHVTIRFEVCRGQASFFG